MRPWTISPVYSLAAKNGVLGISEVPHAYKHGGRDRQSGPDDTPGLGARRSTAPGPGL